MVSTEKSTEQSTNFATPQPWRCPYDVGKMVTEADFKWSLQSQYQLLINTGREINLIEYAETLRRAQTALPHLNLVTINISQKMWG